MIAVYRSALVSTLLSKPITTYGASAPGEPCSPLIPTSPPVPLGPAVPFGP